MSRKTPYRRSALLGAGMGAPRASDIIVLTCPTDHDTIDIKVVKDKKGPPNVGRRRGKGKVKRDWE